MKTNRLYMDLMVPNQPNKDVIFNEALLRIDSFLNIAINGVLTEEPTELTVGAKYVIIDGNYRNCICFRTQTAKAIEYIYPQNGSLVFSLESRDFMLFYNGNWEEIRFNPTGAAAFDRTYAGRGSPTVDTNFTGTNGEFIATGNKPYFYLYLNSNSSLNFDQVTLSEITIIIKQCYNSVHSLTWPYNILWENRTPHRITTTPNATDLVKLYRLPETTHFLGKVIAQNFQF
jgi:hypothetical protein